VLALYTQVNTMFVVLLWVCIHTGQAEKFAHNHGGDQTRDSHCGKRFSLLGVDAHSE
jgi:hypothetical protein